LSYHEDSGYGGLQFENDLYRITLPFEYNKEITTVIIEDKTTGKKEEKDNNLFDEFKKIYQQYIHDQ